MKLDISNRNESEQSGPTNETRTRNDGRSTNKDKRQFHAIYEISKKRPGKCRFILVAIASCKIIHFDEFLQSIPI